jgi:succinate dehydrogenase/fumarate reductase-like Fe-S protein
MPPAEPHRATIERHNGCITCGACDSACASTRASLGRASLGPAALNRVFMLIGDERDASGPARLRGIADDVRALREGGLDAIDEVCPANIPLREAIVALDARGGMP